MYKILWWCTKFGWVNVVFFTTKVHICVDFRNRSMRNFWLSRQTCTCCNFCDNKAHVVMCDNYVFVNLGFKIKSYVFLLAHWTSFSWLISLPFPDQTKCSVMYSFNNVQIMKKKIVYEWKQQFWNCQGSELVRPEKDSQTAVGGFFGWNFRWLPLAANHWSCHLTGYQGAGF